MKETDAPPDGRADSSAGVGLTVVGTYPEPARASEHGLVILAMGHPCWLAPGEDGCRVLVETPLAPEVGAELEVYDRESAEWPPRPAAIPAVPARPAGSALLGPLLWALAEIISFRLSAADPRFSPDRFDLDASAVFGRGQWWRALTSLFLHADLGHLLSNLGFGVPVFSAVLATFGGIGGSARIVLSAVAANLAVAGLSYPSPYRSLGASTAIFAGLGLLTGRAASRAGRSPARRWSEILLPLVSGLVLLAFLGAGGAEIDVAAHAAGFVFGLGLSLGQLRDFRRI